VRLESKIGHAAAGLADDALHWSATMIIPHFVNEILAEMRRIKPGWYAMDDGGKLSSGPFCSHEECSNGVPLPMNEPIPSELRPRPK
jgi:hypothetical protein